jgi:hypothetical protein
MCNHPLGAPAAHSLVECMRELKFGRPAAQQLVVDEACNFVVSRLGDDGPPFNPSIVGGVFDKGAPVEKMGSPPKRSGNKPMPKLPPLETIENEVFRSGGSGSNGHLCMALMYNIIERQLRQ